MNWHDEETSYIRSSRAGCAGPDSARSRLVGRLGLGRSAAVWGGLGWGGLGWGGLGGWGGWGGLGCGGCGLGGWGGMWW